MYRSMQRVQRQLPPLSTKTTSVGCTEYRSYKHNCSNLPPLLRTLIARTAQTQIQTGRSQFVYQTILMAGGRALTLRRNHLNRFIIDTREPIVVI